MNYLRIATRILFCTLLIYMLGLRVAYAESKVEENSVTHISYLDTSNQAKPDDVTGNSYTTKSLNVSLVYNLNDKKDIFPTMPIIINPVGGNLRGTITTTIEEQKIVKGFVKMTTPQDRTIPGNKVYMNNKIEEPQSIEEYAIMRGALERNLLQIAEVLPESGIDNYALAIFISDEVTANPKMFKEDEIYAQIIANAVSVALSATVRCWPSLLGSPLAYFTCILSVVGSKVIIDLTFIGLKENFCKNDIQCNHVYDLIKAPLDGMFRTYFIPGATGVDILREGIEFLTTEINLQML